MAAQIAIARTLGRPFGVNLFAPNVIGIDEPGFRAYARALQPDADRYGVDLSGAALIEDDDAWAAKLDLLLAEPVPVVSVTFGLPTAEEVAALGRAGTRVLVTVTSVGEALAAVGIGTHGLIAQGTEAGGHSGTHDPRRPAAPIAVADLVEAVVAQTRLPVVAAGGVAGPRDVASLVRAGASAVAVGTLLLRTVESGASATHKGRAGRSALGADGNHPGLHRPAGAGAAQRLRRWPQRPRPAGLPGGAPPDPAAAPGRCGCRRPGSAAPVGPGPVTAARRSSRPATSSAG